MPLDLEAIADVVAMSVRDAMAPLVERLALAEHKLATLGALDQAVTGIRERVVVAETKIAVLPQPVAPPVVDLLPLTERVAVVERKSFDVSELGLSTGRQIGEFTKRLEALETRPAQLVGLTVEEAEVLRDRVAALEHKSCDVSELGAVRERLVAVETRQPVPGPAGARGADGAHGKDGADGVGWDDLSLEAKDERTWVVKAARGERVKELGTIQIPAQIQRGIWVDGKSYEHGDVVTWAGSQWHANEPTDTKPGNGSKAWTLVVKCGRDGRDGKDAVTVPVVRVT